jgi:hypothetical protein
MLYLAATNDHLKCPELNPTVKDDGCLQIEQEPFQWTMNVMPTVQIEAPAHMMIIAVIVSAVVFVRHLWLHTV